MKVDYESIVLAHWWWVGPRASLTLCPGGNDRSVISLHFPVLWPFEMTPNLLMCDGALEGAQHPANFLEIVRHHFQFTTVLNSVVISEKWAVQSNQPHCNCNNILWDLLEKGAMPSSLLPFLTFPVNCGFREPTKWEELVCLCRHYSHRLPRTPPAKRLTPYSVSMTRLLLLIILDAFVKNAWVNIPN